MARTPIQTAVARFGGFIEIPVDCGPPHGVIDWRFAPGIGAKMLDTLDRFNSTESVVARFQILRDYLIAVCDEPQRELFSQLVSADVIDADALGQIFRAVREDAAGMDPTPLSSSEDGSPPTGESSTDGVQPEQ